MTSKTDNEVGFGKPPKHTRFKKGQSGNPAGRPKGIRNLKTDLEEELRETVLIREGGSTRTTSKQRAMLKSLVAKAINGDVRAATAVLHMIERLLDAADDREADAPLREDDLDILAGYLRRARSSGDTTSEDGGPTGEDTDQ